MERNPSKYKAILFGNSHSDPKFVRANTVIPLEDDMDLLLVTIDSKLKFDAHDTKICGKVSQHVAVLKRMKKILLFDTRMNLYRAFIVSHSNYCAETWHFCSKRASDQLEKINERALRFVYQDNNVANTWTADIVKPKTRYDTDDSL